MTVRPAISARLKFVTAGTRVSVGIKPAADGKIAKRRWLNEGDRPASYSECVGLRRTSFNLNGECPHVTQTRETLRFIREIIPALLGLAQERPILWVCSREHAERYISLLEKLGKFTILRGSLRKGNPYKPLVYHGPNGGSDDEHIVMLTPGVTS